MFKSFKEFALRGNVMDLAIGVILGAAFGKIVSSFVSDILMPPIGLMLGKVDFSNLYINLSSVGYPTLAEAKKAGAPTLNYGLFLNQVIDFTIVAFSIFMLVQVLNHLKKKDAAPTETSKTCPYCISQVPIAASRCSQCTSELKVSVSG